MSWWAAKEFVKRDFFGIFKLIAWYLKGIPYLKYKLAEKIALDPSTLPYNSEFLSYLIRKKSEGSKIFLATGATEKYANQVADYLKIFDGVFSSDLKTNLVAKNKAQKLEQQFPDGFTYAGNSIDDVYIWEKATKRILVNPSKSAQKAMNSVPHILFKS